MSVMDIPEGRFSGERLLLADFCLAPPAALGRQPPSATDSNRPRVCKNASSKLKYAHLR